MIPPQIAATIFAVLYVPRLRILKHSAFFSSAATRQRQSLWTPPPFQMTSHGICFFSFLFVDPWRGLFRELFPMEGP